MGGSRAFLSALVLAALFAVEAGAQQPLSIARRAAPDSATVGDPFTTLLRVAASPGDVLEFHGVESNDSVQPIDTVRVVTRDDSGVVVAYSLVAWVAATPFSATSLVRVVSADGSAAAYEVPLALPVVASVLPAGAGDLRPRPPRGVIRFAYRPWWPNLLAGAGVAAILGIALWLWRRRGMRPAVAPDPRAAALAALDRLRRGPAEADPATLHAEAAGILRGYLAELDPGWGREWTTTEIVLALRSRGAYEMEAVTLERILDAADRVKFSGQRPALQEGHAFVDEVTRWVDGFELGEPGPMAREAA